MAKQTTKYVVTTEEGIQEFGNLGLVGKFLGKKISKKELEAGKYPMVTLEVADEPTLAEISGGAVVDLADVTVEPTMDDTEDYPEPTDNDIAIHDKEVEDGLTDEDGVPISIPGEDGIELPDDATSFIPEPELDENTKRVLALVATAMDATSDTDEPEVFDALCALEDAITEGTPLTNAQAELLTKILSGQALTNTPDSDSAVDTDNEEEEESVVAPPVSDVEYPEIGDFKEEKAMKKFIKGLSDQSLYEWCILEGAEWKASDHESINRMRMAMAIKAKHFPGTTGKATKKSKSKYASYSTEDLVQMALDADIEVPDDKGDNRILRMYTIMALRKAGIID
jgi:hypothetical protein